MTSEKPDTSREAVEGLAQANETRTHNKPHSPFMTITEPEPLGVETAMTLRALMNERDALKEYAFEVSKALTGLTVGGSEFFTGRERFGFFEADIDRCVRNIQWRMDQHRKIGEARGANAAKEAFAETTTGRKARKG